MDIKNLYKQSCNFEKRVSQLDTHDDTLSDMDWDQLSEKLTDKEANLHFKLKSK